MNLEKIAEICLFLSIVVAPFDGINIINFFIYNYAFCWTTTIGFIVYLICLLKYKKIYFGKLIKIWCVFFVWNIVSTIVNLENIVGVVFKEHSAERMVLVSIVSLFFVLLMMLFYNYVLMKKENVIIWVYKGMKISFYIITIFSIIQLLGMCEVQVAIDLNTAIQKIINIKYDLAISRGIDINEEDFFSIKKIIGVSQEASTFGNYMTCLFPWLILGAIYFDKKWKGIALCCLLVLFIVLSYSRIAYGCIFLELLIVMFLLKKSITIKQGLGVIIIISMIIIGVISFLDVEDIFEKITGVFLSFSSEADLGRVYSNLTRIGLQVAGLNMFISDPIFGLGLSQFRFNYIYFLPSWAYLSPEIVLATDTGSIGYFYSTFNTHIRVLAESGMVGFLIWISFFVSGIKNYLYVLKVIPNEKKIIIKLIMLSYIMSVTGFMNFDEYTFFYYWLLLVLSNVLVSKVKKKEDILSINNLYRKQ